MNINAPNSARGPISIITCTFLYMNFHVGVCCSGSVRAFPEAGTDDMAPITSLIYLRKFLLRIIVLVFF